MSNIILLRPKEKKDLEIEHDLEAAEIHVVDEGLEEVHFEYVRDPFDFYEEAKGG